MTSSGAGRGESDTPQLTYFHAQSSTGFQPDPDMESFRKILGRVGRIVRVVATCSECVDGERVKTSTVDRIQLQALTEYILFTRVELDLVVKICKRSLQTAEDGHDPGVLHRKLLGPAQTKHMLKILPPQISHATEISPPEGQTVSLSGNGSIRSYIRWGASSPSQGWDGQLAGSDINESAV
jgi:hypothetical protein